MELEEDLVLFSLWTKECSGDSKIVYSQVYNFSQNKTDKVLEKKGIIWRFGAEEAWTALWESVFKLWW